MNEWHWFAQNMVYVIKTVTYNLETKQLEINCNNRFMPRYDAPTQGLVSIWPAWYTIALFSLEEPRTQWYSYIFELIHYSTVKKTTLSYITSKQYVDMLMRFYEPGVRYLCNNAVGVQSACHCTLFCNRNLNLQRHYYPSRVAIII